MNRRLLPIAAVSAALLLGASCSGDDDTVSAAAEGDEAGGATETTASDTAAEDGGGAAATDETQPLDPYGGGAPPADGGGDAAEVAASGLAFGPATIEVAAGTTVKWSNGDSVPHTVTAGEPGSPSGEFDEDLAAGTSAEVTFDEAGTFAYFCEVHPDMTGEVVVS